MEEKSVSDCLNNIDIAIVRDIDMKRLGNVHQYLLERGMTDCND